MSQAPLQFHPNRPTLFDMQDVYLLQLLHRTGTTTTNTTTRTPPTMHALGSNGTVKVYDLHTMQTVHTTEICAPNQPGGPHTNEITLFPERAGPLFASCQSDGSLCLFDERAPCRTWEDATMTLQGRCRLSIIFAIVDGDDVDYVNNDVVDDVDDVDNDDNVDDDAPLTTLRSVEPTYRGLLSLSVNNEGIQLAAGTVLQTEDAYIRLW